MRVLKYFMELDRQRPNPFGIIRSCPVTRVFIPSKYKIKQDFCFLKGCLSPCPYSWEITWRIMYARGWISLLTEEEI